MLGFSYIKLVKTQFLLISYQKPNHDRNICTSGFRSLHCPFKTKIRHFIKKSFNKNFLKKKIWNLLKYSFEKKYATFTNLC